MMKMLKKHYEKFIFIFLLLIFLLLFGVQVLSIAEEQPADTMIPPPRKDYKKIVFTEEKYDASKLFGKMSGDISRKTTPAAKDSKDAKQMYSEIDLLAPPRLARCPVDGQQHLIPVTDFPTDKKEIGKKKCSSCNAPLNYVPPELFNTSEAAQSLKDSDNDGIPDDEEKKVGLNPQNPNDAAGDLDKDGFSNLEEFRLGTMINNPKSRPSYATKLFVKEIKETPIGIRVTRFINDNDEKHPEKWTVQLASTTITRKKNSKGKVNEKKSSKTVRARVGREYKKIGTDGHTYKVERIIPKFGDKDGARVNISTVILKRVDTGELFSATVDQDFIDPKKEIVFECQLPENLVPSFNKELNGIVVKIGAEFKIGNADTGVDVFATVSADRDPEAKAAEDRLKAKVQQKNLKAAVYFDIKTRSEYGNEPAPEGENPGALPNFK